MIPGTFLTKKVSSFHSPKSFPPIFYLKFSIDMILIDYMTIYFLILSAIILMVKGEVSWGF